jgi:bacteriocin biosynthesis cyclodehydratase domain-containing protein
MDDQLRQLAERRFVVADGLDVVPLSEDEVLIRFGTRSEPTELLRDIDLHGTLAEMFRRFEQGPRSVDELTQGFEGERLRDARETLTDLIERGILVDASASLLEHYLGFALTGASSLADARVGVIDTGSVGRRFAAALGELGVEPAAFAHDADDVESLGEFARNVRVGVVALDGPNVYLPHVVNRVFLREQTPWLLATLDGARGLIGPLFVPGRTACYNDLDVLATSNWAAPTVERRYRRHLRANARRIASGPPIHGSLVADYAALATLQFLLRGCSFAVGRLLTIDFERMRIDVENVLRLPRCPVCGDLRRSARAPLPVDLSLDAPSTGR